MSPDLQKIVSDMEPKLLPLKRNSISFDVEKEKRSKKIQTRVSPSPSKYTTRANARVEAASSPMRGGKNIAEDVTNGNSEKLLMPRRGIARQQGSPTDSTSCRVTRSLS
jgi:hypothetical protein